MKIASVNWSFGLLTAIVLWFELQAPSTKVEESFNMQAIHDLLYENSTEHFDHHSYPGVVPRTFFGALLLAGAVAPVKEFLSTLAAQHASRLVLGCFFLASVWFAGSGISSTGAAKRLRDNEEKGEANKKHGPKSAASNSSTWFFLLIASQFHVCFYATRTLPNTFALVLTTISLGLLLRHSYYSALAVLGAAATVFRCDLLVLIAPLALLLLISSKISVLNGALVGLGACFLSLLATAPVDSLLWRRLLWPEGEVLFFNAVLNKSHEWGTLPFHSYFTSILPRALLSFYPVVFYSALKVKRMRIIALSALTFVALYSALPHKELRFVMPVFPMLLAPVAAVLPSSFRTLRGLGCLTIILAHFLISLSFAWASSYNYPGSAALEIVHNEARSDVRCPGTLRVFIDDYAAMSGINRFQQLQDEKLSQCQSSTHFLYEKNPVYFNSTSQQHYGDPSQPFDFIIVRSTDKWWHEAKAEYVVVAEVGQLDGVNWRSGIPPRLRFSEFLLVMKRRQ